MTQVGHESEGSLLSELKKKGWCTDLNACSNGIARGFGFFNLSFENVSEDGLENIEGMMQLAFQYLNMLRKEKPQEWLFNEINELGK